MATSGIHYSVWRDFGEPFHDGEDGYYRLISEWELVSQDAVNKTSTLKVTCSMETTKAVRLIGARGTYGWEVFVNGVLSAHYPSNWYNLIIATCYSSQITQLIETTVVVPHDTANSIPFELKICFHMSAEDEWNFQDISSHINFDNFETYDDTPVPTYPTFVLDALVRKASIIRSVSGTSMNDEMPFTIEYANPMRDTTTLLQAAISVSDGKEFEVPYRDINKNGTQYTFPAQELEALWTKTINKTQGGQPTPITSGIPLRFYVKCTIPSFDGTATEDYENYVPVTLEYINYRPVIKIDITDINPVTTDLTGNPNIFIRSASHAQFNLNAQSRKGATTQLLYIDNNDNPINANTGTFYGVRGTEDSATFLAEIKDSRNHSTTDSVIKSVADGNYVPYVPITCAARAGEISANGNLVVTVTGKYYKGSFGAKDNTLTFKYRLKTGADWSTPWTVSNPTVDSNNNYTYSFTVTGLDYNDRYTLTVCAADLINCEGSLSTAIVGAVPIFDWSGEDFAFYVPVTINDCAVPTLIESGNSDGWTYRKWDDGIAECWKTLSVSTAISNSSNAGWYSSGELSQTNLVLPFTFIERPTVTTGVMPTGQTWAIIFPSNTGGSTTRTGSYQLNSMSSFTSKTYQISYQVKGRWK